MLIEENLGKHHAEFEVISYRNEEQGLVVNVRIKDPAVSEVVPSVADTDSVLAIKPASLVGPVLIITAIAIALSLGGYFLRDCLHEVYLINETKADVADTPAGQLQLAGKGAAGFALLIGIVYLVATKFLKR